MDYGSMDSWITGLGKYGLIVIAVHHLECGIMPNGESYFLKPICSYLKANVMQCVIAVRQQLLALYMSNKLCL